MAVDLTRKSSQTRILRVLEWIEWRVRPGSVTSISQRERISVFGNLAQPLARAIEPLALEIADNWFNKDTGVCKKYRRNEQGLAYLRQCAGVTQIETIVTPEFHEQLTTGRFVYHAKSQRMWNSLQFQKREIRDEIFDDYDYRHHYDIQSAAASLLLQAAQMINPQFQPQILSSYVCNKTEIRQSICQEATATEPQVKQVINALLHGAILNTYLHSSFCEMLNQDLDLIRRLQQSQTLRLIREDISNLWRSLKPSFDLLPGSRLSGRAKAQRYRQLEKQVTDSIKRYIRRSYRNQDKTFWIHDGWVSDTCFDISAIERYVRHQTGYSVSIDWYKR